MALGCLGYQLFNNHIHHGACGKSKQVGEGYTERRSQQQYRYRSEGLDDAAERSDEERTPAWCLPMVARFLSVLVTWFVLFGVVTMAGAAAAMGTVTAAATAPVTPF